MGGGARLAARDGPRISLSNNNANLEAVSRHSRESQNKSEKVVSSNLAPARLPQPRVSGFCSVIEVWAVW